MEKQKQHIDFKLINSLLNLNAKMDKTNLLPTLFRLVN